MDTAWLLWSSLFSLLGLAGSVYGRRQRRGAPLLFGVLLMLFPYFVSSTPLLVGIGTVLVAAWVWASRLEDSL